MYTTLVYMKRIPYFTTTRPRLECQCVSCITSSLEATESEVEDVRMCEGGSLGVSVMYKYFLQVRNRYMESEKFSHD